MFTPFHLVFGKEAILPIEWEILALHLAMELLPNTQNLEKTLIMLKHASEDHGVSLKPSNWPRSALILNMTENSTLVPFMKVILF